MKHWILTRDRMQAIVTNLDLGRMKTKGGKESAITYLEDMNKRLKNETFKIA